MDPNYKTITVTNIREEVPGVKLFYFGDEDAKSITYEAGQFLTLVADQNESSVRRSYSITSSPLWHEPLTIGVKRIENGYMSRKLIDDIQVGDKLTTIGAAGRFILPPQLNDIGQLFFFAAGSGITPIFSLIKTVLAANEHTDVVLIYSNASAERTMFYLSLQQLQHRYPDRFHVEFIFSNNPQLLKAHLHADLIMHFLAIYAKRAITDLHYYICGPVNYMRLCTYTLQQNGVPADRVKKESFNADKVIVKAAPPDLEAHKVVLQQGEMTDEILVQYPYSILSAAKRAHIDLPYSCEMGRCGNCVAKCISGKVWHSNNEVLTDNELAAGWVLTCVGFPEGGEVVLKIP